MNPTLFIVSLVVEAPGPETYCLLRSDESRLSFLIESLSIVPYTYQQMNDPDRDPYFSQLLSSLSLSIDSPTMAYPGTETSCLTTTSAPLSVEHCLRVFQVYFLTTRRDTCQVKSFHAMMK